jgi:DNA-binding transcriptional ArsR family regulator
MGNTALDLAERQAALCRAFGNPRRLLILWLLSKEELSVNTIAERSGSSPQNVSQHLSLLKKYGMVTTRRAGQTIYYQIADQEYLKKCPALLRAPNVLDINESDQLLPEKENLL